MNIRELPGLTVTVDRLVYLPDAGAPDKPYRFIYFLTIHNGSTETVTVKGRKWIVREADGETLVVEGDGVVGEFPCLEPGESFSYDSSHVIALDAVAEGAILALTDKREPVLARIPAFTMKIPE